jgi:hypothetical protein
MLISDGEIMFPQLAGVLDLTPKNLSALIGTISPARAFTVELAYIDAFFDQHLGHHPDICSTTPRRASRKWGSCPEPAGWATHARILPDRALAAI